MRSSAQSGERRKRRGPVADAFRRLLIADERGVTAVEFGMLALPFFAIIGAILETGLMFLGAQILDSAVDISVRQLRTGQQQTGGSNTLAGFRSTICGNLYGLFDCSQLHIVAEPITDFASANMGYPLDQDTGAYTGTDYYDGGVGSDIMLVKVYYKWPTILDFFNFDLADTADGKRLMSAVRVFKNEPF